MEQGLGVDLSGVRLHTDGEANALSRSLNATAFTTGRDVFFRDGAYQPGDFRGRELLAHELTHVVQQSGGVSADVQMSEPGDESEREADRIGARVARTIEGSPAGGSAPGRRQTPASLASSGDAMVIQRRVHTIPGDYSACRAQADQWQANCGDRGNLLCSILGARVGIGPGRGAPVVGAGVYGYCERRYNEVCRATYRQDNSFCDRKKACIEAGIPSRRRPSDCGGWWANWSAGGSGDPWPDFDDGDTYSEWASAPSPAPGSVAPTTPPPTTAPTVGPTRR